ACRGGRHRDHRPVPGHLAQQPAAVQPPRRLRARLRHPALDPLDHRTRFARPGRLAVVPGVAHDDDSDRVVTALDLRAFGVALALLAGGLHLVLSLVDLIPGETTTVPAFAAMGLGFLGCAAILALRRADLYIPVPGYAGRLVFPYSATTGEFPNGPTVLP